jgi:hypothetical protein
VPDRYAPALPLYLLALWFVARWVLPRVALFLLGRALICAMSLGVLATLADHRYAWAGWLSASAALAWLLLRRSSEPGNPAERRWRGRPASLAWRRSSPEDVITLCERRIGLRVDAAVPATIAANPQHCILALAGDGVWVLEDESRMAHPQVGRVLTCWSRRDLVAHLEPSGGERLLELSWPAHAALVRGVVAPPSIADAFACQLLADEFARRS